MDPGPAILLIILMALLWVLGILHFKTKTFTQQNFGIWVAITTVVLGMTAISLHSVDLPIEQQISESHSQKEHLWVLKIKDVLKPGLYYQSYIARVESVDGNRTGGYILCRTSINTMQNSLNVDEQITIWAKAEKIDPPKNPYQFDYKYYLQNLGIYHKIKLTDVAILANSSGERTFIGLAARIREKMTAGLKKLAFGKTERSIIQALLLGDKKDIDETTFKSYKNAGVVHILAISGLHVGIVLLLLQYLLQPLKAIPGGRTIKLIVTVLLLWAFALITGFSASVVRAVTMFSFVAYAVFINRPGSSFNILALSMFFTLLFIDPLFLFQLGFQLSYAAVFSILWIYPKLVRIWMPNQFLLRKAWQLFSVGFAAQVGVLPLSLYYFHQFPGLFFISNMAIVPFLGIILGLGFTIMIMAVFITIPDFLILIYDGLIRMMNNIVDWIAHQEAFLFTNIYFDRGHLLLFCILVICILYATDKLKPNRIIAVLCCCLALQLWSISTLMLSRSKEEFGLMHSVGETVLFYRKGNYLKVLTDHPEEANRILIRHKVSENIKTVTFDTLRNIYQLNEKTLIVINNPDILDYPLSKAGIVLLSDSPAINLDRYLSTHQPEFVVVDGSNYKSYTERWKRSCHQMGIPIHDTNVDGALYLDLK